MIDRRTFLKGFGAALIAGTIAPQVIVSAVEISKPEVFDFDAHVRKIMDELLAQFEKAYMYGDFNEQPLSFDGFVGLLKEGKL